MTIQTTRRAVLVGAPAIALVATIPGTLKAAPRALRGEWEAALAKLRTANTKYNDYAANVFDPAWNAEKAFEEAHGLVHKLPNGKWSPFYYDRRRELQEKHGTGYLVPDYMHKRNDALAEAISEAEMAVLNTPAPDLAALRWKLDELLKLEDHIGGGQGSTAAHYPETVNQTLADIARLLPPAA